ncbi:ABC transporter permease [Paenibacillus sp. TRM 82003]|nr:ABC transporter permease [Paenibacillus sp. TRM 82003]
MKLLFGYLLKNMGKDVYTIVYSVGLPIALLIGLFLFFEEPAARERMLVGVLALNTMMGALNLMAFDVLQPRNRGVLKLVKATPTTVAAFLTTFAGARIVFTLALNALVLLAAAVGFGVRVDPVGALAAIGMLLAGAVPLLGLGFLCGNLAKHEGQVNMLTNLLCFPMIFTSDSFYSMANAPAWANTLGALLPYRPFVDGLGAALAGDLAALPAELGWLALFAVVAWAAAAATFRWDASEAPAGFGGASGGGGLGRKKRGGTASY